MDRLSEEEKIINLSDDVFEKTLLADMDKIKHWLKYYINRTKELENELEYYKNAYENRVDEFINRDRWE